MNTGTVGCVGFLSPDATMNWFFMPGFHFTRLHVTLTYRVLWLQTECLVRRFTYCTARRCDIRGSEIFMGICGQSDIRRHFHVSIGLISIGVHLAALHYLWKIYFDIYLFIYFVYKWLSWKPSQSSFRVERSTNSGSPEWSKQGICDTWPQIRSVQSFFPYITHTHTVSAEVYVYLLW